MMKKKNNVYKYHFVYDNTPKSQKLKKTFKKFKNHSPKKTDIIIVAGGDGFMLHALKNYINLKNHFTVSIAELSVF